MKKYLKLKTLINITLLTELIPLIFCIFFYKKINIKSLKVFFVYSIFQVIFISLCSYSIYELELYSIYIGLLRLHLFFEYTLITIFLYFILKSRNGKIILKLLYPLFFIYNIYDYLKNGNDVFGDIPTVFEFLLFIIFIILYFFESMQTQIEEPVYKNTIFWICVGLFVYFSGNFFYIVLVENSKNENESVRNQLKIIYSVVSIIKNLILGFAIFNHNSSENNNTNPNPFPQDIDLDAITPNKKIS